MKRLLITGGSGFIGTNLVESLLADSDEVLSIDIQEPQNKEHNTVFKRVDILERVSLERVFKDFAPTHVVHLAARTDLHEKKNLGDYKVNIKGVENMVRAVSAQPSVVRCIFTSTKLVCQTDYAPKSMNDYCPNTLYGESKVMGEKIVKDNTTMRCDWCIVRPTSIWGPWSDSAHISYGKFFRMIARGCYFHPGRANPPRSFGYVGNFAFQIKKLFDAPVGQIHKKVFYLTDYDCFTIKEWADMISVKLKNKRIKTIPEPLVRLLAWVGDLLKLCGVKEPPFSSFRLHNMRANTTGITIEPIKRITGPLPYSMEQGVEETIAWLQKHNLIR